MYFASLVPYGIRLVGFYARKGPNIGANENRFSDRNIRASHSPPVRSGPESLRESLFVLPGVVLDVTDYGHRPGLDRVPGPGLLLHFEIWRIQGYYIHNYPW